MPRVKCLIGRTLALCRLVIQAINCNPEWDTSFTGAIHHFSKNVSVGAIPTHAEAAFKCRPCRLCTIMTGIAGNRLQSVRLWSNKCNDYSTTVSIRDLR